MLARITAVGQFVMWDAFEQPYRPSRDYSRFGPYRFGRRQYQAALERLCADVAATEA